MTDTRFRIKTGDRKELQRTFEQVPRASHISTTDGPNSSNETGTKGQLAIDRGSSDTDLWICHADGTSNWSEFSPAVGSVSDHTHDGSDLSAADGSTFSFFDDVKAPGLEAISRVTMSDRWVSTITISNTTPQGASGIQGQLWCDTS